jgi:predicted metal-dependent phosphoesterase TrpH
MNNDQTISIDLHNHSVYSYDGKLELVDFLENSNVNIFAITDHNNFKFHEIYSQGKTLYKIKNKWFITGEEMMTSDAGEIIGLFIKKEVKSSQTLKETLDQIKEQEGIAYLPHPYDLYRKGKPKLNIVLQYIDLIDIIEVFNAKYFTNYEIYRSYQLAKKHNKIKGYGSDAHKREDLAKGFVTLEFDNSDLNKDLIINLLADENNVIKTVQIKRNIFKTILKKLR